LSILLPTAYTAFQTNGPTLSIRDLARHLNVSIGTVSRALNGRSDVSPATRRRILEAAAELGYSPNQSGRSLRQGVTGMIAWIIPINQKKSLADTIFMTVLDGLRVCLAEQKRDLLVLLSGPEEDPYAFMRRVAERRIADGLIIADTQRIDPRIDYLIEKKIPFVAFGRSLSGGAHPWIDLDFEGVADAAIARFVDHGHRRIALATTRDEINYGYVFDLAYRQALARHGIAIEEELVLRVENSEDGGYEFGGRLMEMRDPPTAALLVNEYMVVGLYRRLREAGLAPGSDLSIIGFQEEPSAHFLSPRVTCFRSALRGLGARLGESLIAAIQGNGAGTSAPVQEVWPMELVAGESDGPVPQGMMTPAFRSRSIGQVR
jgi:DNA-binding LacI/PurR family transcriptional regulator